MIEKINRLGGLKELAELAAIQTFLRTGPRQTGRDFLPHSRRIGNLITSLPPQARYVLLALCNSIIKLHAVDVGASTIYEEYLNIVKSYSAKELTDRRIADYIWELDNTGLTISRISAKRYGKERVVRLGVPINIITRILQRLENG